MNDPRLIFLWIALTLPPWVAAADPVQPAASAMDATVRELGRQWLERNDGIGLTVGIYDNGQRHFYNFGSTQLDGNRPPTKDTVYEIGSISKTLAGQFLARALVEGRASLN